MKLLKGRRSYPVTPQVLLLFPDSAIAGLIAAIAFFALGTCRAWAIVQASIAVDAKTGAVLEARNANVRAHPASLTKLMTLYITFERLESHKLMLDTELQVSRHAAEQPPMKLWLRPGSRITVRSAILGIVTLSANDAAVVLAENIASGESGFAVLMNSTAHRLGMEHTRFYNASGLPSARQWTTARDMSILALALIDKFPGYYHFFSVRSFRFHGRMVYGHNHVLNLFAGADGLKTGYIRSSGYNLVTSAVRHHRRLVGVVLGGATAHRRDLTMVALLTRAFSSRPSPLLAEHPAAKSARNMASIKLVSDETHRVRPHSVDSRRWVVQIGGDLPSKQSARHVLRSAARTDPDLPQSGRAPVVKLGGRHYRARFSMLSEKMAFRACRALGRKGFTCQYFDAGTPMADRSEALLGSSSASSQGAE